MFWKHCLHPFKTPFKIPTDLSSWTDKSDSNIWNGSFEFHSWSAPQQLVCSPEWIWRIGLCSRYFSAAEVEVACSGIMLQHISVTCLFMQPQVSPWVLFGPQCRTVGPSRTDNEERKILQTFISIGKGLSSHNSMQFPTILKNTIMSLESSIQSFLLPSQNSGTFFLVLISDYFHSSFFQAVLSSQATQRTLLELLCCSICFWSITKLTTLACDFNQTWVALQIGSIQIQDI